MDSLYSCVDWNVSVPKRMAGHIALSYRYYRISLLSKICGIVDADEERTGTLFAGARIDCLRNGCTGGLFHVALDGHV